MTKGNVGSTILPFPLKKEKDKKTRAIKLALKKPLKKKLFQPDKY